MNIDYYTQNKNVSSLKNIILLRWKKLICNLWYFHSNKLYYTSLSPLKTELDAIVGCWKRASISSEKLKRSLAKHVVISSILVYRVSLEKLIKFNQVIYSKRETPCSKALLTYNYFFLLVRSFWTVKSTLTTLMKTEGKRIGKLLPKLFQREENKNSRHQDA